MSEQTCACGHVRDEHTSTASRPCLIEDCPCLAFEHDPDALSPGANEDSLC
jgi:hypothetical protein